MRKTVIFMLIFTLTACTQSTGQIEPVVTSTEEPRTDLSSLEEAKFTPTPSSTPDITPEPLQSKYELPAWMKMADTEIIAALIRDDIQKMRWIAFFNASSGDRYDIALPNDVRGVFWYDNANFGFLSKDLGTMYRMNLSSGLVTSESVDPQAVRLLDPEWVNGLKLIREGPNSPDFTFDDAGAGDSSKTKRYTAEKKTDWVGIIITDNTTKETVWELSLPIGIYTTVYAWSPVDDNILAYVQGEYDTSSWITQAMTLNIVDVVSGKTLGTYSGDFGRFSWSPDGRKILHQDAMSIYNNYGFGFVDPPCIISLDTNTTQCVEEIPKFVPSGYELASTGHYEWLADGRSISFVYLYYSSQDFSIQGNFCIYNLGNEDIRCPTQGLEELKNKGVTGRLSPSEQYIEICISTSTILNDYAGSSEDGIMRVDGTGFFSWIGWLSNDGPDHCSNDTLWRPLP